MSGPILNFFQWQIIFQILILLITSAFPLKALLHSPEKFESSKLPP